MKFVSFMVTFQEVPTEVSLSFFISGCSHKCKNCHSAFAWDKNVGEELSDEVYLKYLNKYKNMATCVLFLGGEWYENRLIELLKIAKEKGFKTCLYTGNKKVSTELLEQLDYLKTGEYIQELGGLDQKTTNQKFIRVQDNADLTYLFWR